MIDQAEALRHLVLRRERQEAGRQTRIVTVTSGKGGVGKSNFSLNFALCLQRLGQQVLVFDADIGMANMDVLMGQSSRYSLYHLLKREKTIWDIIQTGPENLHYVAGGSGFADLLDLTPDELDHFTEQIGKLQGRYDIILFDTGAGLSKEAARVIAAAEEAIVVTTPEPTSITDAYALVKMVLALEVDVRFRLVVNRAESFAEGRTTAEKIDMAAKRFLKTELPTLGIVRDDVHVRKAVRQQVPFTVAYPDADASRAIAEMARKYLDLPGADSRGGGVRQFIQRMFGRKF
ncbi:MinD/ParA family protein [Paenibacillus cisolokensis]